MSKERNKDQVTYHKGCSKGRHELALTKGIIVLLTKEVIKKVGPLHHSSSPSSVILSENSMNKGGSSRTQVLSIGLNHKATRFTKYMALKPAPPKSWDKCAKAILAPFFSAEITSAPSLQGIHKIWIPWYGLMNKTCGNARWRKKRKEKIDYLISHNVVQINLHKTKIP